MTDQMEKARLGSHPNLYAQSQSINLISPMARRDGAHRDADTWHHERGAEGWHTSTSAAHTPPPNEYRQHEIRRASDPVRCVDPSFNELKKLQHRYKSAVA